MFAITRRSKFQTKLSQAENNTPERKGYLKRE